MVCLVTFRLLMFVGLKRLSAKTSYPRQVKSKGLVSRSLQGFVSIARRRKSIDAGTRTSAPMPAADARCKMQDGQLQEATGPPHTHIYIPDESSGMEETSCMKAASVAIGACDATPLQAASTPPETRACSTGIQRIKSCDDGPEHGQELSTAGLDGHATANLDRFNKKHTSFTTPNIPRMNSCDDTLHSNHSITIPQGASTARERLASAGNVGWGRLRRKSCDDRPEGGGASELSVRSRPGRQSKLATAPSTGEVITPLSGESLSCGQKASRQMEPSTGNTAATGTRPVSAARVVLSAATGMHPTPIAESCRESGQLQETLTPACTKGDLPPGAALGCESGQQSKPVAATGKVGRRQSLLQMFTPSKSSAKGLPAAVGLPPPTTRADRSKKNVSV